MHDPETFGVPELVWPSQVWNAHLATCPLPRRRCGHDVALPDWWVARMRRGVPLASDADEAIAVAMKRINGYKGTAAVSEAAAEFTRNAVRDALPAAPQPVTRLWVSMALSVTAQYATWVHNEGEPLTVEHVFASSTRKRYLNGPDGPTHLSAYSRRNYRLRLDVMAVALLGTQRELTAKNRRPLPDGPPLEPLTRQQEADLWVWSQGLRPISVRQRIQAVIVTGLGVGTRRRDFVCVRGKDITRDEHGVHVAFPETTGSGTSGGFPARVTTCTVAWEDRLWEVAQDVGPEHYLAAPWRTTKPTPPSVDNTMRLVVNTGDAPVDFSSESLRNTWLLRHLEAGTPLNILMEAAALTTTATFDKLRIYLPPPDPATRTTRLRGVTR